MAYSSPVPEEDYRAKDDARTLTEAEKIKKDKKRLKAAMACLKKDAEHSSSAHESARSTLESKTKNRLKKVFDTDNDGE